MSWWVYLEDRTAPHWCSYGTPEADYAPEYGDDKPCSKPCYPNVEVPQFSDGGTYARRFGGVSEAALNITYNYGVRFREAWDGVGLQDALHDKPACEVIRALEHAVNCLGTERSADYWESTPGNAGAALARLLEWARQHPDAVFQVH